MRTAAIELAPQRHHGQRRAAGQHRHRGADRARAGVPRARWRPRSRCGRLGTVEDIGYAALFLATDEAATSPARRSSSTAARCCPSRSPRWKAERGLSRQEDCQARWRTARRCGPGRRRRALARADRGRCAAPGRSGSAPSATSPSQLGVSRSTLRQALAALEGEGMVRRVPGAAAARSSAGRRSTATCRGSSGVPALLRDQGFMAGIARRERRVMTADGDAAEALRLARGRPRVDVVRIRLADGGPISLEHAHAARRPLPGLLELPLGGSIYELLEEHYGAAPSEAVERIEVGRPRRRTRRSSWACDAGAPLLSITRHDDGRRRPADRVLPRPVPGRPHQDHRAHPGSRRCRAPSRSGGG